MRTLRLFLKRMKVEKSYLIVIAILSVFIVIGYASYAMFTVNKEQKQAIRIITGTLTGELKVDNVEADRLVVNQGETKEFTITLRNNNDRTARYLLYYIGTLPEGLEAGYVVEEGIQIPPENKGRNITVGTTETYKIKVKNGTTSSQTIQLKLDLGLEKFDLTVPNNEHLFEKYKTGTELFLLNHVNSENSEFNDSTKDKMFVYHHEETEQQKGWSEEELTDYRYIGANPNNWISFNGGTWRIIGVFTVENENGKKEKRMKLIRNVNITNISYDNKPNGTGSSESSDSSNDWTDARLMMLLNPGYEDNPLAIGGSLYWNRQSGKCPYGKEDRTADCDFTNAGFLPEYQEIIASTKWYLGGNFGLNKPSEVYNEERGTNTCYTEGNCLKERQVNWIGKVGLMYVSDYGYATSGSSTVSKEECLDTLLSNWSDKQDCVSNNWLFKENLQEWTLNNKNTNSYHVAYINEIGKVAWRSAYYDGKINNMRPAIYLISDIQITGTGSKDDPFVFTK